MQPSLRLVLIVLAFVLFAVAAYLSTDLASKLTRAAFALITLAWLF